MIRTITVVPDGTREGSTETRYTPASGLVIATAGSRAAFAPVESNWARSYAAVACATTGSMTTFAGTIRSFTSYGPLMPAFRSSAPAKSKRTVWGVSIWDQSLNMTRVHAVVTTWEPAGVPRIRTGPLGAEAVAYTVPDRSEDQ